MKMLLRKTASNLARLRANEVQQRKVDRQIEETIYATLLNTYKQGLIDAANQVGEAPIELGTKELKYRIMLVANKIKYE